MDVGVEVAVEVEEFAVPGVGVVESSAGESEKVGFTSRSGEVLGNAMSL